MADWPLVGGGAQIGTQMGTSVTASASTNTKGSWTELIASLAGAAAWVGVQIQPEDQNSTDDFLVDIGIGSGGSEKVLIPNLLCSGFGTTTLGYNTYHYLFPIGVSKTTRISARCQSTTTIKAVRLGINLFSKGFMPSSPLSSVVTWGAATGDSGGTSIDPGAIADTKGSWVELSAAAEIDVKSLAIGLGNQRNTARTTGLFRFDIGIGAASSEKLLVSDWQFVVHAGTDALYPTNVPFLPIAIPKGTRVAARGSSQVTDATDRLFDVVLYGAG